MSRNLPEARPTEADGSTDDPAREGAPGGLRKGRIVLVVAILVAAFLLWRGSHRKADGEAAAVAGKNAARVIPVLAAAARTGDMAVSLTGLGTVTALNTVTVRSRIDGELLSVAFKEGQLVREGDLLAQIDPRPYQVQLTQAEGQAAKDQASLANARLDLERFRSLFEQGTIPRMQLDAQQAMVNELEASLKSDQGTIDGAKLNIAYSRITASLTGRVGLRLVDAGNMVHANDPGGLLVITQLEPINVVFTIPADRLPQVLAPMREGRKLVVEAFDRSMQKKLATGTLVAVDNQIDQGTGTVKMKAEFRNQDGSLFPNQFVNVRLLVDTLEKAVLVPAAAIQRSPQSTFVWVVGADSAVELRNVEVERIEGEDAAIRKGLTAGELVVIDGVDKLQPRSKVAVNMAGGNGRKPGP